jgi:hypothetical protein
VVHAGGHLLQPLLAAAYVAECKKEETVNIFRADARMRRLEAFLYLAAQNFKLFSKVQNED